DGTDSWREGSAALYPAGGARRPDPHFVHRGRARPALSVSLCCFQAWGQRVSGGAAPDALSGPMAGREQIYGDFGAQAMGMSPSTRLQTTDGLKVGLAALAVGATVAVANRFLTNGNS